MKYIEFTKPQLPINNNLAIIGSAGNLSDSKHGELIDSFDDIVRFNRAVVDEHEEDVGSKETIRVANDSSIKGLPWRRDGLEQPNPDLLHSFKSQKILCIATPQTWQNRFQYLHPSNKLYYFNFLDTWRIQKKLGWFHNVQISVGMLFVLMCVNVDVVPHLFGFYSGKLDHYFWQRPERSIHHNFELEMQFRQKLEKERRITCHE